MEQNKSTKKRILLWGWYGFENLGDDLLLTTMLQHIDGDITVPMQKTYKWLDANQVKRNYFEFARGVLDNDAVIIGPGGLFPFDNKLKVLVYYLVTRFWKLMGRKVIFFGIGISKNMSQFSTYLWRNMANTSELFITRSEDILEHLGLKPSEKIHIMADCVFASKFACKNKCTEDNKVAISVVNLQDNNQEAFNDTAKKWSEVTKYLISQGFTVDLIAFTKGADDKMVDAILSNLEDCKGKVIPIYYSQAMDAVNNWNKYKFAICMRFHSLVLSILNSVPAIPIAYGHKTLSLAEKCGLGDYTLIWNTFQSEYYGENINITSNQIIEKIDLLCSNLDSIKHKMTENKCDLIESATNAFKQLKKGVDR